LITIVACGVGSVIAGGKFENGAKTAAYGYLFNQMMSGTNGAGPNQRHALGVDQAIADDVARGFTLVGREVSVEIEGQIRRYDYVIRDPSEMLNIGVEVKTTIGDTVQLDRRQVNLDVDLMRFGGVAVDTSIPVRAVGYRAYCFFLRRS
jgi:hypothetical protein